MKVKVFAPLVFLGLALFSEVLVVSFYFPKKIFALLDLKQKVTELSKDVGELKVAEEALGKTDKDSLSGILSMAEAALPSEKQVAGVVSGINTLASSSGVVTKGIEFSPGRVSTGSGELGSGEVGGTAVGDGVIAVPVSVSVFSSLDQLLDFMNKLQSSRQLLGITSANYTSVNVPEGSLGLVVYFLPGRSGKPGWRYVPIISPEDLAVVEGLSGKDIFNLGPGQR